MYSDRTGHIYFGPCAECVEYVTRLLSTPPHSSALRVLPLLPPRSGRFADLARVEIPDGDDSIRGASFGRGNSGAQPTTCCPIVELRQYTLHPGKRDVLIDLFDREFVESQEALGMKIIGQFRDLDNPNRFVWLRGFRDMPSARRRSRTFTAGRSGRHIAKRPTPP